MSDPSDLDAKYNELCSNVGHLFITFARLETALGSLLKLHLANAMAGKADVERLSLSTAVYGGMRFTASRDAIKRIVAAEKAPQEATDLATAIFPHVGEIQGLRDKIAHHLLMPAYIGADAYWQITDAPVTRDIRNPKVYVFDSPSLIAAANDLMVAAHRFGKIAADPKHVLSNLQDDLSPISWQYRPSMLKLVPQSKLRSPLGPFRRP